MARIRTRLKVLGLLLCGWLSAGCMQPAALPPPTASIPPQTMPPMVTVPLTMPASTLPRLGSNPWKPTVTPRDWQYLVIHHTATGAGSVESINASHLKNKDKNGNPWLGVGYHFVIGNGDGMADGAIEPTFRWRTQIQGAHAGSSNKDYNERGIGICLVGNFEKSPPTPAQKRSIKLLVQTLKSEYRIPSVNIVGHKDIRASATECPGKLFPMAEIAGSDSGTILGLDADGVPLERVASNTGSSLR